MGVIRVCSIATYFASGSMPPRKVRCQKTAFLLSDLSRTNPKTYVHHKTDAFTVTSDIPIANIATCDVLQKSLFGDLGCFFYPSDSVVVFHGHSGGTEALQTLLEEWVCQCKEENVSDITYQISVAAQLKMPHEEENDDEEEDDVYLSASEDGDEHEGDDPNEKEEWITDDEMN